MHSPDENLGFGCWPDFIRMNLRKILRFCPVQKAQILTFRIRPLHLLSRVLGTVVDFDTPQHTVYPCRSITGINGYMTTVCE